METSPRLVLEPQTPKGSLGRCNPDNHDVCPRVGLEAPIPIQAGCSLRSYPPQVTTLRPHKTKSLRRVQVPQEEDESSLDTRSFKLLRHLQTTKSKPSKTFSTSRTTLRSSQTGWESLNQVSSPWRLTPVRTKWVYLKTQQRDDSPEINSRSYLFK